MTSSAARMTPTRRYFERRAEAFDRLYTRQSAGTRLLRVGPRRSRDLAVSVVARQEAPSVLDVGCGPGRVGEAVMEAGAASYVGVDFSPHMLRLAQARLAGLESVQLIESDFFDLELPEKFDVVLALGLFDYLDDPARAAAWMRAHCAATLVATFSRAGPDQDSDSTTPLRGRPPLPDLLLRRGRCRGAASARGLCARRVRLAGAARLLRHCEPVAVKDRARPAAAAQRVRQALGAVRGSRDRLRRELAACGRPRDRPAGRQAGAPDRRRHRAAGARGKAGPRRNHMHDSRISRARSRSRPGSSTTGRTCRSWSVAPTSTPLGGRRSRKATVRLRLRRRGRVPHPRAC